MLPKRRHFRILPIANVSLLVRDLTPTCHNQASWSDLLLYNIVAVYPIDH